MYMAVRQNAAFKYNLSAMAEIRHESVTFS